MTKLSPETPLAGFERLINSLALESINIPVHGINLHLKKLLSLIGRYAGVERCTVILYNDDRSELAIHHEWSRRGFTPGIYSVKTSDLPQTWQNSRKNTPIMIPDVTTVRHMPHSGPEKIFSRKIKSLLLIPLCSGSRITGYLGLSSVKKITSFTEELKSLLVAVGELIVSLLEKKAIHSQLELSERIVSKSTGQLAFFDRSGTLQFYNESFRRNFMGRHAKGKGPGFAKIFKNRVSAGSEHFFRSFNQTLAGRDSRMEVWIKNREDLCLFEIILHPNKSDDGEITGVFFNSQNITERVQLEAKILKVISQERKKIGINLHDELGHDLLAIDIRLKLLSDRIRGISPDTAAELVEIETSVKEMMRDVRRLSHGLIPFKNQGLDLKEMLDAASIMMYKYYGLQCTTFISPEVRITDESVIGELYNIITESVVNSVKHSGCDQILITIHPDSSLYVMTISDNGSGMNSGALNSPGAGIEIMKYRARSIGGILEISSSPLHGTTVRVTFNRERISLSKERNNDIKK